MPNGFSSICRQSTILTDRRDDLRPEPRFLGQGKLGQGFIDRAEEEAIEKMLQSLKAS